MGCGIDPTRRDGCTLMLASAKATGNLLKMQLRPHESLSLRLLARVESARYDMHSGARDRPLYDCLAPFTRCITPHATLYGVLSRVHCPTSLHPQDHEFWYQEPYWHSPYLAAAQQGDVAMLQCLQRIGYPTPPNDETLLKAVRAGCRLEVLQCMADSGFPVCWHDVEAADREGRPAWRTRWSERSVWVHHVATGGGVDAGEGWGAGTGAAGVAAVGMLCYRNGMSRMGAEP